LLKKSKLAGEVGEKEQKKILFSKSRFIALHAGEREKVIIHMERMESRLKKSPCPISSHRN
jgi:hypothetical protein